MKRVVCFLIIACLLLSGGCVFDDPAEVLYENLSAFSPSFDLWTDDVTAVFKEVLREHPDLQVYVGQVKTVGSRLRQRQPHRRYFICRRSSVSALRIGFPL